MHTITQHEPYNMSHGNRPLIRKTLHKHHLQKSYIPSPSSHLAANHDTAPTDLPSITATLISVTITVALPNLPITQHQISTTPTQSQPTMDIHLPTHKSTGLVRNPTTTTPMTSTYIPNIFPPSETLHNNHSITPSSAYLLVTLEVKHHTQPNNNEHRKTTTVMSPTGHMQTTPSNTTPLPHFLHTQTNTTFSLQNTDFIQNVSSMPSTTPPPPPQATPLHQQCPYQPLP